MNNLSEAHEVLGFALLYIFFLRGYYFIYILILVLVHSQLLIVCIRVITNVNIYLFQVKGKIILGTLFEHVISIKVFITVQSNHNNDFGVDC